MEDFITTIMPDEDEDLEDLILPEDEEEEIEEE